MRIATNQALYGKIHEALGEAGTAFLDSLFLVGDDPRRVSPWHDLKKDPAKPTIHGMRDLLARFDQLTALSGHNAVLKKIPVVKVSQWALEGNAPGRRKHGRSGAGETVRDYLGGDSPAAHRCDR